MLIKVCPKSGERQSKNDFLLIFFYIQSKGAAQSSILMILRHPHIGWTSDASPPVFFGQEDELSELLQYPTPESAPCARSSRRCG